MNTIEIKNQLTIESSRSPVRQKYIVIFLKRPKMVYPLEVLLQKL